VACESLTNGCHFRLKGGAIEVSFSEPANALRPFELRVRAPSAKEVTASFTMTGMEMGLNRYQLVPAAEAGNWRARVILPVCVAGRSDWEMTLVVDGAAARIPFSAGK
jgi:hypothetical protein